MSKDSEEYTWGGKGGEEQGKAPKRGENHDTTKGKIRGRQSSQKNGSHAGKATPPSMWGKVGPRVRT